MTNTVTRRTTLLAGLALGACAPQPPRDPEPHDDRQLLFFSTVHTLEQRIGGRVGVAAWNTGTDHWLSHRHTERFAMCSMFKWLLAAQMLQMDERSPGFRDQQVRYDESDLAGLGHIPVTQANLARGWMTVEQMSQAIAEQSDNAAANLLLEGAMGPEGFTRFLRANGDGVTRLDRNEPSLNENLPGDERDTTTPDAMVRTMIRFLTTDDVLNARSRETLTTWLVNCQTGLSRLRAGLPSDWRVGDKTGTSGGENNATTDVAIAWPPGRAPIVIACFLSHSTADAEARNAAHAEVARIAAQIWS